MGFQLQLLCFGVFLLLILSFVQAKNVTFKVVGFMHCTDCIRREFNNSQASLSGIDVFIHCASKNREMKTQGNGAVDKEGKFNVTLSTEITEDGYSIESCFAKLQTASSSAALCPLQSAQNASVKLLSTEENAIQNKPTIIKFSTLTCQSAFFWPHPNFTFFPASPPPTEQPVEYAPPPSEALPPVAPPVQPPLPPVEDLVPSPAPPSQPPQVPSFPPTLPPSPEIETPSPPPDFNFGTLPPTPAPTFQSPQHPPNPTIKNPSPPPTPQLPPPPPPPPTAILPPIPPKKHEKHHPKTPIAQPPPVLSPPPPFSAIPNHPPPPPLPKHEKPIPPSERKPNPIPRAPPVPRLPPIPTVPRKYFNSPKSKSKPPHSS